MGSLLNWFRLKDLKNIQSISDLSDYIDYLRGLNPEASDREDYATLKEFMRFSPERLARKLGIDEVDLSKRINNIKGELNKKIKHVVRIEKMNSVLPSVGNFKFRPRYEFTLPPGTYLVHDVMKLHCISVQDSEIGFYRVVRFFRGVIYSYFIYDGKYYVSHRNRPGGDSIEVECPSIEFFRTNFMDAREWKINQIMISSESK